MCWEKPLQPPHARRGIPCACLAARGETDSADCFTLHRERSVVVMNIMANVTKCVCTYHIRYTCTHDVQEGVRLCTVLEETDSYLHFRHMQ